ncbi:hypothetical protein Goarm_013718 [Gossypium armourianum]|uniref:Uncharacterized protein n=1 Tax=Gossypium armourianum TaxID=34283 RepID=A0A7J9J6M7_9ROSI|nr:hypothetical protein [Gossypium armourianum]
MLMRHLPVLEIRSKCRYMAVTATLMPSWLPVMWILSLSPASGHTISLHLYLL